MNYFLLFFILIIISIIILIISFKLLKDEKYVSSEDKISIYGITKSDIDNQKIYDYDDIPVFRDLPLKEDYYMAFYLASQYGLNKNDLYLIDVILLKWIKDGNVLITDDHNIKLNKEPSNKFELDLYNMMLINSEDNILNNYEFKRYCKRNYKLIGKWLTNVLISKQNEIINNREYIDVVWIKDSHIDGHYEFRATDKLNNLALQLAGLKKYFHSFTMLDEKKSIEVRQWQEYLIYAAIFGVATNISEEFNKINVGTLDFTNINIVDNFIKETIVPSVIVNNKK